MKVLLIFISLFSFPALAKNNSDYVYSMSVNENKILHQDEVVFTIVEKK